jgi:hypothetical protein
MAPAAFVFWIEGAPGQNLIDTLDRAAGGPDAGRGCYVLDDMVNGNGGQFHILRNDVSDRIFQTQTAQG